MDDSVSGSFSKHISISAKVCESIWMWAFSSSCTSFFSPIVTVIVPLSLSCETKSSSLAAYVGCCGEVTCDCVGSSNE